MTSSGVGWSGTPEASIGIKAGGSSSPPSRSVGGGVTVTSISRLSAHFDSAAFCAMPFRTSVTRRRRVVECSPLGLSSLFGTPRQGARGGFLSSEDGSWALVKRTCFAITSLMCAALCAAHRNCFEHPYSGVLVQDLWEQRSLAISKNKLIIELNYYKSLRFRRTG